LSLPTVTIRYQRLGGSIQIFEQVVLDENPTRIVTFLSSAMLPRDVSVNGKTVLEIGSPVIWFTYPGRWYDVGLFHLADGTFTGFYANILTPVEIEGRSWSTTDLCLDVWAGADGSIRLLDEEDLARASSNAWLTEELATRAVQEAEALLTLARAGRWPDAELLKWTLPRVREMVD